MPDARLRRTRATLPEGYQYGESRSSIAKLSDALDRVVDAVSFDHYGCGSCGGEWRQPSNDPAPIKCLFCGRRLTKWRAPHENAAAQLKRREIVSTPLTRSYNTEFNERGPIPQRTGEETV